MDVTVHSARFPCKIYIRQLAGLRFVMGVGGCVTEAAADSEQMRGRGMEWFSERFASWRCHSKVSGYPTTSRLMRGDMDGCSSC
jgi:hypothetical protein